MKTYPNEGLKKSILALAVLLLGISTASATIIHDTAPSWRGNPNTTYQAWGFDNDNSPADLDINVNPYGAPMATITGIDPPLGPPNFIPPNTYWKDYDNGHQGVWHVHNEPGDSIQIYIPNNPVPNPEKIIWLQMTYYASGETGAEPEYFTFPDNVSVDLVSKTLLDAHYYYHSIWEITIQPNPVEEWIIVQPRDCTLYCDEIVVDTICIPEPLSIVLLGFGGLLLPMRRFRAC